MVDTAGTLTKAADLFLANGALSVRAICTHAVLSGPAFERIESSGLTELVVTDSIPAKRESSKIKVLSVAKLYSDVMNSLVKQESISKHF
jgi:ribose-phosphate pyrophosphokinase